MAPALSPAQPRQKVDVSSPPSAASADHEPEPLRPPLKWAGGKRWLLPYLRPLWQQHRDKRLVEPLAGGLAVALGLRPRRALLNDLNPHNINFYRWLAQGIDFNLRMSNDRVLYYRHRKRFNDLIAKEKADTPEAAQLFFYLNRTGYNGLCRFNHSGQYNVPFGRHETVNYAPDLSAYPKAMSGWQFTVGDFATSQLEPDDFVYADPPYDVEFTQYSKETFGWEEQVRLAEWLSKHCGPVVLSNQATGRILDLYGSLGFNLEQRPAPRMISCNGDRTKAMEVIATKGL
jgi:DNA adenine methylase